VKKASPKPKPLRKASAPSTQDERLVGTSAETSTSDRILRSATQLFATLGFANTSMPAIAKLSGITQGAIYRHFESKAELLLAVVRHTLQALPTDVWMLEPAKVDATDLPEFVANYVSPGHKLIRQLSLEIHYAASREETAYELLRKVNEEAAQAIRRSIVAAQNSGDFDPTINANFTARFFLVMIMGLSHMDTLEPDLIGDSAWHNFILERLSALVGLQPADANKLTTSKPSAGDGLCTECATDPD
jgi:AcrR family transcriptional regulator